jgi:hypothetical protein
MTYTNVYLLHAQFPALHSDAALEATHCVVSQQAFGTSMAVAAGRTKYKPRFSQNVTTDYIKTKF